MSCNCPKCCYTDDNTVEEIRQKLGLPNNASNNNKPLSPTEFKCISTDGKVVVLNSKEVPAGTLMNYGNSDFTREAFRALAFDRDSKPWVLYTNARMSHEQFAEMMNNLSTMPKVIHWGL